MADNQTININLTPKEHQLIQAERERESDKQKAAKREANNKESETNKKHFETALQAIRSTIDIFDYECTNSTRNHDLPQSPHYNSILRGTTRNLLVKMKFGMEALVAMAGRGIDAAEHNGCKSIRLVATPTY